MKTTRAVLVLLAAGLVSLSSACGSSTDGGSTSGSPESSSGSAPGPSGSDPGCADCGECGIAGPVMQDGVRFDGAGIDAAGRPAVSLRLEKAQECRGQSTRRSTLRLVGSDIEVTQTAEKLDESVVSTKDHQKYVWSDRDLGLTLDFQPGVTFLSFTGATAMRVGCRPDGEAVRCTKE